MNHKYFLSPTTRHIGLQSLVSAIFFLVVTLPASADFRTQPIVLHAPDGSIVKTSEICGDFIDQDADGKDLLCSGNDQDRDGYVKGTDCDDTNRYIYPGVSVGCDANCGTGWKTCGGNGAFTACTCTPLCEATGSGRCYYVSALTGDDNSDGSFNHPWRSVLNIASYYTDSDKPTKWVQLTPGDVAYLMNGIYRDINSYKINDTYSLFMRHVNGTAEHPIIVKNYPGSNPIISSQTPIRGIALLQSSHIILDGLEVANSKLEGIHIMESSNVTLQNLYIHDIDGSDNDNLAGLKLTGSSHIALKKSVVRDNYDRTNLDTNGVKTSNSRNIVLFSGGWNKINGNVIFQTRDIDSNVTGGCIAYKHSMTIPDATFIVSDNILFNCSMNSIGSGSYNTTISNNLLVNSDPIRIADFGGPTYNQNILIEKNTIWGSVGLDYRPTDKWGDIGVVNFHSNIIYDRDTYHNERGILTVGTYENDVLYDKVVSQRTLFSDHNCIITSNTPPKWSLFAANRNSSEQLGGLYSFEDWKLLSFDGASTVRQLNINDINALTEIPGCENYGFRHTNMNP